MCSSSAAASPRSISAFPMRYSHSSLEVCDLADLEQLTTLAGRRRSRRSTPASASIATTTSNEPLSRHRHRHLRIEGRASSTATAGSSPARRSRTRCWCRSRAGPSTGRSRTGGAISPSSRKKLLADSEVDPKSIRAVGGERHRPVHAAGRCRRRGAVERRALWRRCARREGDRGAQRRDRRGTHPRALRQRADLAVGRAEDPVAEEEPPGDLRQGREDRHVDDLSRAEADRRVRDRPLFGGQFLAALCRRQAGLEQRARARHHRPRSPAAAAVDDRHRRPCDGEGGARDRACRRHAGDRRHHRCGVGSAQRRRASAPAT